MAGRDGSCVPAGHASRAAGRVPATCWPSQAGGAVAAPRISLPACRGLPLAAARPRVPHTCKHCAARFDNNERLPLKPVQALSLARPCVPPGWSPPASLPLTSCRPPP